MGCVTRFIADDRGATAVEYGLIVALIALAIIGSITALGRSVVTTLFNSIGNALTNTNAS